MDNEKIINTLLSVFGGILSLLLILLFNNMMYFLVDYYDPIQINREIFEKCIDYYFFENNCQEPENFEPYFMRITDVGTAHIELYYFDGSIKVSKKIYQFDLYYMKFKIFTYNVICKKNYYCYLFLMTIIKLIFLIVAIPFGCISFTLIIMCILFYMLFKLYYISLFVPKPNILGRTKNEYINNNKIE